MLRVVAQVKAGEEYVPRSGRVTPFLIEPEDTQLTELVGGKRIGGAGIAPAHVPGVFEKNGAHVLSLHLLAEKRLVEAWELVLYEEWNLGVRGEAHGSVVGGLYPSPA